MIIDVLIMNTMPNTPAAIPDTLAAVPNTPATLPNTCRSVDQSVLVVWCWLVNWSVDWLVNRLVNWCISCTSVRWWLLVAGSFGDVLMFGVS